jgi:hypothetical protein
MELRLEGNRFLKYVLVFGLAIVFMAIVILFLGNNAEAVVIVDQAGGGDYLTIQEGVDNAIPGETVYVWDGSYNENITIDKPVILIGNGSVTTIIDASGLGNNAVNITTEGVEIQGFNITNNATYYGISAIAGGFDIHHNEFFTTQYAIWVDIYYLNPISTAVGSMFITDNTVAGGLGFYFNRILFDTPASGSDIVVGQTIIDNNDLDYSSSWGITLWGCEVVNMNGGSVNWGGITITNNFLDTTTSGGIALKGNMENLTDVSVVISSYDISGNNITCGGTGIQVDWWSLQELYGTTSVFAAQTMVNDNNITGPTDGIQINLINVGYYMYDDASVTIDDFIIDPNIIDAGNYGIYFYIYNSAYEMYNDSSVHIGDYYIDMNYIISTGNGIDVLVRECGAYMYDNAQARFDNFYITNNNVTSTNENGIHFRLYQVGYHQYDNSRVMMGEVHVMDNDVAKIGGVGYGLSAIFDTVGTQMYGDSYLSLDDWYVEGNTVTSTGHGVESQRYECGYETFDNSMSIFHNFYVRDNVVDATELGMWALNQECGKYMEDFSTVIVGNMSVMGNNVSTTNNYGLRADFYESGQYNYDESYARVGWYDVSYNNFSSVNNYGGYVDIYYLGAYMYGSSQAYIGDITITDNEFWSTTTYGLYLYQFYENAYEMYDKSYVQIGDVLVNNNYVNAGGDGIYLDTWTENAYNMYQSASADFGNFEFNNNVIEAGEDGIYVNTVEYWAYELFLDNHVTMGNWQFNDNDIDAQTGIGISINYLYYIANYMYGTSTFEMENFEVLRNTIQAGDDGIFVNINDIGYYNYGSSEAYFTDFLFNNNVINASGDGLYVNDMEYWGSSLYDYSLAVFGDIEINNNEIIAGYGSALGYDGIRMYFYENGYENYGNSQAYFGHLEINDNTVTCTDDDGIYFEYFYEIGKSMYDNSYFEMGNVEVQRNWVDAADVGIYIEDFEYLAYNNYDNSQAYFGDFLFNENNITSGNHGILGERFYYWGYELYNDADAYFGNVEFNNNTINASGYGIRMGDSGSVSYGFYYWGSYLYGDNEVIIGHVHINDNDVLATGGDGINVYYFYDIGYEMYMNSYFYMENFEICRNIINASEDGIEMYEIDELAYTVYDSAQVYFGDFLFNDNDIIAGNYGFYNEYIEYLAYDMYGSTYAEFGNFEFNRNTIVSGSTGMYWNYGFYDNAYQMEDGSSAMMGHYQINDNDITSTGGDGIYFYEWYDVGYYMQEDAYFEMENLEVCRNTIDATGYGIYWYYFEDVAYYMGSNDVGSTTFIMGDILFNDNTIISSSEGIYLYDFEYLGYYMYGDAYAEFGNFEVSRNHITSTMGDGIYLYEWYEWAYEMYDNAEAHFGSVLVNDNNITAGNETEAYDGIYMYEWYDMGAEMYDKSSAYFGNFEMSRNIITSGDYGIYISDDIEDLAYDMYGSNVCYFGDFLWNDNVINAGLAGSGYGIYISYIEFLGYELNHQSDAYFGNFELNRNIINSYDDGILVYSEYWCENLRGDNEVIFGHFQINDNVINATNGIGIYAYHYEIAYYMDQSSYFRMENYEICRNQITAGNESNSDNDGIYIDIEELATYMDDTSSAYFGDFLFNDNVIVAPGPSSNGIYISYMEYLGYYISYDWNIWTDNPNGACYVEFGNIECNRNTITSTDDGIYVSDWEYWGYEIYGSSEVHFGHIQFNDNWIRAGNATISSDGMYFSDGPAYDFAYNMYGNSYATFENIEVCRNTVNSTDYGIYLNDYAYLGMYMYDSSRAEFQDFLVCENEIISGNDGIYNYYFYYVGAYMYDESYFVMGDFQINDNLIKAGLGGSGDGIYLDEWSYNGYEMYSNTYAEFGSFEVCRNWIDPPGYGIYIYPNYWGAYMYDQSIFIIRDWLINNNTIVSSGDDGIYFYSPYFGYENHGTSRAYFGVNEIMFNTVNSTGGNGIEARWWYEFGAYLYDYAHVEVGSCYIMHNDVTSWSTSDYGILTGPYVAGRWVYDDSQAYFGDYVVSNNNIFTNSSDGIYFYYYQMGYWIDSFNFGETHAIVVFGETRLNDNIITAPDGDGIYFDGQDVGEETHDYSQVTTGDIQINRNKVYSNGTSLYIGMEYFGYDNDHNSQTNLGVFYVDDNILTSYNGTGIEIYIYYTTSGVIADSYSYVGDIFLTNNEIYAGWIGIECLIEYCIDVSDNAVAHFPGLYVIDNWVESDISAFNHTSDFTPGTVDPTTTLTIGDVVLKDNYFDGGFFGAAFDWDTSSSFMPVIYLINDIIEMGSANSTGLYMRNVESAYIDNLLIDGYNQGIYVNNSNIWLMFNSTITNVPSYDLNLTSDSFIGAVNCTFDKADVYYEDDVSELKIGWFMNVLVITQAGYGVPGAHVVVGDVYGTITFDGSANTLGQAFYRIAWEYLENITGIIDTYNNHTADADKDSVFGFATPDPLMDQTKLVIIILGDSVPPNILGDLSDISGTTGDPFNFGLDASDNFGIYSAHVNYRFVGMGSWFNVTMTGTGPFSLIINIPSNFVGTLRYYFSVQDVGGNWVSTGIVNVPITDNDAPVINADNSDSAATTGDPFNFLVAATDNVAVAEAHVVWWFDSNPQTDDIMNGVGPYDFSVVVPSGSLDELHYYFRVRDAAGNWFIGTQVNVTVTDNDAPVINADNSDTTATTGEQFFFDVDITDNIGMNATNLVYWFGLDAPTNVPMNGTGPYTYNISVPSDSLDMLHYYFTAVDDAGNWLFGAQVNVTVVDNDAPTGLADTSDTQATTDDSFSFQVNATDNIGISDVYVIYWFGTGNLTNASMIGTGPFDLGITIPSGSLDTLHYYFAITDADGNWLVGSQVDITVADDDAPTIDTDDSDITADAGETFYFQINATDNIGVTEAYVIYWFDSGPEANATMIGAFNRSVIIAPDATTLHYYFAVRDAAGNWEFGNQVDVDVTGAVLQDDIPPTLDSDDSDTEATTGDSFEFDVTFNDNIAVTEIHVVYWFNDDTPIDTIISGTYTIAVPSDSLDTLHYYFTATDAAGNEYVGTQVDIDITDNDPPYNLLDESDTSAGTGDTFTFNGEAEDNIGVTSAEVVYWFDTGAQTTTALTGTDPFTLDITIPSSAGVMHYYLVFYDAEGNTASTQPKDITIADNEPGSLSNDASDTSGQEGETFNFQVDASDNVGVSEVFAVYWFGDDESTKVLLPLAGAAGTYSGSFTPSDHGTMHYYFMVVDSDGNEFEGSDNTASITEAAVGPGQVTEEEEPSIFPWILVVVLIIVVLLLLLLLMRKKGEEPEAIPAETEPEEGGGVEGEYDEEVLEEPGEGLEEELEAEEGDAIPDEEESLEGLEGERFEDLEKVPGVDEGGEVETSEETDEGRASGEEAIEEESGDATKEEAGEGVKLGEITCPNCGIASSADSEECPICRTKFE